MMTILANIRRRVWPPRAWILALAAMVAVVSTDTLVHLRTTWDLTGRQMAYEPPVTDASSPSGYAANQHVLVLPYIGMDGYHWVMQTQQMLATGEWRVRRVNYDNAPDGREVHWSSLFRWWLAALAEADHFYTATPLPQAVEDVVPFANTLLIVLLFAVLTPVVARRFGSGTAALLAFGAVGVFPFYESFIEGRTDHHGLAAFSGLLTLLLLLGGGAGWVKNENADVAAPLAVWLPDRAQARRWFIASGVAGGCGLWISLVSEVPVLAGIGLGALLATGLLGRGARDQDDARPDPTLWRVWALAGAATSVFFYLVEYFPSHMEMRLEVNHPLYALAWAGAGEWLYRISRWWSGGKLAAHAREWMALAAGAAGVLVVPVLWWLFADQYFWVFNHFLWVFHVDYIMEFVNMGKFLAAQPWLTRLIMASPLVLLPVPMLAWSWQTALPRPAKALLLLGLAPGALTFLFSVWQIRWAEINYALWLAALVGVVKAASLGGELFATRQFKAIAAVFLAWVLLPNPVYLASSWVDSDWKAPVSEVEAIELITRDVAQQLRARTGGEPAVIVSGPTSTTWLIYWGGFQGLGTFYWENLPGMKANAEIYGTTDLKRVVDLLARYHAKYLVILPWVDSPDEYARLWSNLRASDPAPADAFAWHMQHFGVVPSFLRPVNFTLPSLGPSQIPSLMVYEFAPGQTSPEALARLAEWQLENGRLDAAASLLTNALHIDPNCKPALIDAAMVDQAKGVKGQFAQIAEKLSALTALDDKMELEDRVRLAVVFNGNNDQPDFKREMAALLHDVDASSLRRLSPQSRYNLLMLCAQTGQMEQRPGLWAFINTLQTPDWRIRFLQGYADEEKAIGRIRTAEALLRRALATRPESITTLDHLARLLATTPDDSVRKGKEAIDLARRAHELDQGQHVNITDTLACALAENGEYAQAVKLETEAIQIADQAKATTVADTLRIHLELFKNHLPYREGKSPGPSAPNNH